MIAAIVTIATLVVHLIFLGRFLYRVVWLGLDLVEDDDDESENATADDSLEETKDGHLALVISRLLTTTIENSNSALKEHMDTQTARMNDICDQLLALDKKTTNMQPVHVERQTERIAAFDTTTLIHNRLESFTSALQNHTALHTSRMDNICRQLSTLETKIFSSQQAKQSNENDEHGARTLDVTDIDDVQKSNTRDLASSKGIEVIMTKLSALEEKFYTLRQDELSHSQDQVADLLVANDKALAATIREHEQKNAVALKTLAAEKDALIAKKDHQLQVTMHLLRQEAVALEQARFEYTKLDVFQTAERTTNTVECATQTVECATKTAKRSTKTAECATQTSIFAVQTTNHDSVTTRLSKELSEAWGVIDQCDKFLAHLNVDVDTLKRDMNVAAKILIRELGPLDPHSHILFRAFMRPVVYNPVLKRDKILWPGNGARSERLEEFARHVERKIVNCEKKGKDEASSSTNSESGSETSARSDASSYTSPASSQGGYPEKADESEQPESPIPFRSTSPYRFTEATGSSSHTSYGEGSGLHYDYGSGASYEGQVPYPRSESPLSYPEEDPDAMDEGSDSPYRVPSPDYSYFANMAPEDCDESSNLDERPDSPMSCRSSSPAYEPTPTAPEDFASSSPTGFGARTTNDHPSPFAFNPPPPPTASGRTTYPSASPFTPEGRFSRPAFVPPSTYRWQTPGASTSTLPTPPPFSAPPQPPTKDPRTRPQPQERPIKDLPKRWGKGKGKGKEREN